MVDSTNDDSDDSVTNADSDEGRHQMGGIAISLFEGEGNKANNDNMYSGVLKNLDWTTNVCDINCILIKCLHSAYLQYYIHSCTLIRILSHILLKSDYNSH